MDSKLHAVLLGCVLASAGMLLAMPASAHHSVQAEFDVHKSVSVTGTVLKIEAINPHSYLTITVKDANGNEQKWGFEFGGPRQLRQAGLGRAALGRSRLCVQLRLCAAGSQAGALFELA